MAGFNTAVTGLKSASTMLDVAGNNIANASTVGFKSSRTEFGDIYATAVVGAGSSNTPGSGVTVTDIAQDFSGGTIEFTNSNLDLAINGSGFFMLDDGQGNQTFTRAGAFELDKDGYIKSKSGKYLQGWGLDPQGNVLTMQNLGVTEKESTPKPTETISLSFNINSGEKAEDLASEFNKTNPGSYTYSTTVGTFNSLGQESSIRFYFAEQRPVRETYAYAGTVVSDGTAITDYGSASLSGFQLADEIAGVESNSTLYFKADGTLTDQSKLRLSGQLTGIDGDPRIDADSVAIDVTTGDLSFEVQSKYSGYGSYYVVNNAGAEVVAAAGSRVANEEQRVTIDTSATGLFTTPASGEPELNLPTSGSFSVIVAGVEITIRQNTTAADPKTLSEVGAEIAAYEQDIIDKNPNVESVEYNSSNNQIVVKWKADAGDVPDIVIDGPDAATFFETVPSDPSKVLVVTEHQGDNSYLGAYRSYAFLDDNDQLNIGKEPDPGSNSADDSEVGPVIITFNSTTGLLETVNGDVVPSNGNAPRLTIRGADTTNPEDTILASDVDDLPGIQLDISGSSQFASESIVKNQRQDGYTKGDLIGVSFSETGEMVASFSNGQRANLGLVAIATFENQDGLQPSGNTEWIATLSSGNANPNPPGTGLNGTLRSAALEQSNVDLSEELVKLIEGQRNFQANSKTLETLNTVTQAILQI